VIPHRTGFLVDEFPGEVVDAVQTLSSFAGVWETMSGNCQTLVREKFSITSSADQWAALLKSLVFNAAKKHRADETEPSDYYALEGISMIHRVLGQVRDSGVNPRLELLGVVMTMFDGRTRLSQQVVSEVREHFGDKVFETVIPRTTRLAEAPSHGQPIIHYDKYSAGAAAYEVLAQEVLERLK